VFEDVAKGLAASKEKNKPSKVTIMRPVKNEVAEIDLTLKSQQIKASQSK
jgi:hypothetical protein